MAKFYVASGSFRGIVDSVNAATAAVWAIHRVMNGTRTEEQTGEQGLFRLRDEIGVSERGFGGRDAVQIPTRDAFLQWAQLVRDSQGETAR